MLFQALEGVAREARSGAPLFFRRIVEEVLDGEINPAIVKMMQGFGGKAVGIRGRDVLVGKKLPPQTEGKSTKIDMGFVGEVIEVQTAIILKIGSTCRKKKRIPIASKRARTSTRRRASSATSRRRTRSSTCRSRARRSSRRWPRSRAA